MGAGEGGSYSRGGASFKFRLIGGALVRRGRLFEGGGALIRGRALIRRFTVITSIFTSARERVLRIRP